MKIAKNKVASVGFPTNTPLEKKELVDMIKESEKGPFYTPLQVKEFINKWSKKYSQ